MLSKSHLTIMFCCSGYLPPEFINFQVISKEYDIYSLGVIITKIITGITGYSDVADMGAQEFVEHVRICYFNVFPSIRTRVPLGASHCTKFASLLVTEYRNVLRFTIVSFAYVVPPSVPNYSLFWLF
jgi:serine/threonine protein kinase